MIGRETRMLLRHYLEQGASKSALARQLGVSRDTVHRWIREGELDRDLNTTPVRYGPRRAVPTKLDAYKPIIETRLAAYPALSAVRLLIGVHSPQLSVGVEADKLVDRPEIGTRLRATWRAQRLSPK